MNHQKSASVSIALYLLKGKLCDINLLPVVSSIALLFLPYRRHKEITLCTKWTVRSKQNVNFSSLGSQSCVFPNSDGGNSYKKLTLLNENHIL